MGAAQRVAELGGAVGVDRTDSTRSLRRRVYDTLEARPDRARGLPRVVSIGLLILIAANVLAVVLESVRALRSEATWAFVAFEWLSVAVFSVEYLLRLWSCTSDSRYRGPIAGRLRFAARPLVLIDLAAILPAFLPALLPMDLRFIRALRLLRLSRALKVARYSDALAVLGHVLKSKASELAVAGMAGLLLLLLASSLVYYVENPAQPERFSSIPAAMWWGVCTLTTVGYGDIYPVTPAGKLLGGLIGIMGIGLFALPAGILAGGFAERLQGRGSATATCPHCGKSLTRDL